MSVRDVYIISAIRTPVGGFGGALAPLTAPQLGAIAIKEALKRAEVPPEKVDEVILGHVLSANVGQTAARQASLGAGIPASVPAYAVNKVCASGMKAVALAAQSIALGNAEIVVAGGMESMSNVPYYAPKARFGLRYGSSELVDGIEKDGLYDSFNSMLMGKAAELCATEHGLTREAQDDYAIRSYKLAQEATANGVVTAEIVPVNVPLPRGKGVTTVTTDEDVAKLVEDKLRSVKPAFDAAGTVTAPNSSPLSDGAAALVLASGAACRALHLVGIGRVRASADAACEPERFTIAPSLAIPKALAAAGIAQADVDLFEINEAFAAVALANCKLLGLPIEKVNILGGSVAIGHPLGCSGARIIVTLLNALYMRAGKLGVAAVCNGGGGASAIVIEAI